MSDCDKQDLVGRSYRQGQAVWTRVGSAWAHSDGAGFNIQPDAVPIDGKITLRTFQTTIPHDQSPQPFFVFPNQRIPEPMFQVPCQNHCQSIVP